MIFVAPSVPRACAFFSLASVVLLVCFSTPPVSDPGAVHEPPVGRVRFDIEVVDEDRRCGVDDRRGRGVVDVTDAGVAARVVGADPEVVGGVELRPVTVYCSGRLLPVGPRGATVVKFTPFGRRSTRNPASLVLVVGPGQFDLVLADAAAAAR